MSLREQLGLYLVTDRGLTRGRPLLEVVEAALAGGVDCVQLREKSAGTREFIELGRALQSLCARRGALLIVNDRADVALACRADGLHVGQSDMTIADARRLLGPQAVLGLSVENLEQALGAEAAAADYLGVSPVFATATKPDADKPWGLDGLRELRRRMASAPGFADKPLVAIGGINDANASEVLRAGADGLAVVSALCSADDPMAAAQQLRTRLDVARR